MCIWNGLGIQSLLMIKRVLFIKLNFYTYFPLEIETGEDLRTGQWGAGGSVLGRPWDCRAGLTKSVGFRRKATVRPQWYNQIGQQS